MDSARPETSVGINPHTALVKKSYAHHFWTDNVKLINPANNTSASPGEWARVNIDLKQPLGGERQTYLKDVLFQFEVHYAADARSAYACRPVDLLAECNLYCNETLVCRYNSEFEPTLASLFHEGLGEYDSTYAPWQLVPSTNTAGSMEASFAKQAVSGILCTTDYHSGATTAPFSPTVSISLNRLYNNVFLGFPAQKLERFTFECRFAPAVGFASDARRIAFDANTGVYSSVTFRSIQCRQIRSIVDYTHPLVDAPIHFLWFGFDLKKYPVTFTENTQLSQRVSLRDDFPTRHNIVGLMWCFAPAVPTDSTTHYPPFVYTATTGLELARWAMWQWEIVHHSDLKQQCRTFYDWMMHRRASVRHWFKGNDEIKDSPFYPTAGHSQLQWLDLTQGSSMAPSDHTVRLDDAVNNVYAGLEVNLYSNTYPGAVPGGVQPAELWVYMVYQNVFCLSGTDQRDRSMGTIRTHINVV